MNSHPHIPLSKLSLEILVFVVKGFTVFYNKGASIFHISASSLLWKDGGGARFERAELLWEERQGTGRAGSPGVPALGDPSLASAERCSPYVLEEGGGTATKLGRVLTKWI